MISFQAFNVRFSLPLLTLIVPFLATRLGMQGGFFCASLALCLHELAHLLAAKLMGVEIAEIRLMPFGGSARLENPYQLNAGRIIPVAAAGPLVNILLAVCFAAMAHWRMLQPAAATPHIQANLILFAFNLLPALPLDGGRILFALLRPILGEGRALGVCIWTGRLLASALLLAALLGFLHTGICNLSLILAAVFILASARDERIALCKAHAQRIACLMSASDPIQPLRLFCADESLSVQTALHYLRAKERTWFVLSHNSKQMRILDDRAILDHLLQNGAPDTPLGQLKAWQLHRQCASGAGSSV